MESILTSIKKLLGIPEEDEQFDVDIIVCINTTLSLLNQLGVGPSYGFTITGKVETWSDLLQDESKWEMVKSYVHLKVKLLFDPPTSSALIESMNNLIKELEWRITVV